MLAGLAFEFLSGTTYGKPVLIEQRANLANQYNILALVVTAIAAAFNRAQAGKLLFPVTQYMGLNCTELADLTDGEVALAGDSWRAVIGLGISKG